MKKKTFGLYRELPSHSLSKQTHLNSDRLKVSNFKFAVITSIMGDTTKSAHTHTHLHNMSSMCASSVRSISISFMEYIEQENLFVLFIRWNVFEIATPFVLHLT